MHDSDINHKEEKQVAVRPRWDEHGRRCPLTHRKSHTYPQIIRKAISCFPKIWAKALATQQSTFATAKNSCNGEACSSNVGHVNAARSFMRTWLQQRFLATNFLARSETHEKGHAMAMGRGVYTSRDFGKACQYATPHIFLEHDIKVLVRGVLLVPLPQASTLQQPPPQSSHWTHSN